MAKKNITKNGYQLIHMNGKSEEVPVGSKLAEVLPENTVEVITNEGAIYGPDDFQEVDVPESFDTSLTQVNKGYDKSTLLGYEINLIQSQILDCFPSSSKRTAFASKSNDFIVVKNFPLPDGYKPDFIDLVIVTTRYPESPPLGFHIMKNNNEKLLQQLKAKFGHTFEYAPYDDVEEIPNYYWVCYHYADFKWNFNVNRPNEGDNLYKYLSRFFSMLEADS